MIEVFFRGHGYWERLDFLGDPNFDNPPDVCRLTDNGMHIGVFCLNTSDEITHKYTERLDGITQLLPSTHKDSNFIRCKIGEPEGCYFRIVSCVVMKIVRTSPDKEYRLKTEVTETERNSMLKLILGMAIDSYGYDPDKKNSATGDKNGISTKLATHNIKIDSDTVRKYLTEAKKLL